MKLLSERLAPLLGLSIHCTHIKGHGGLKQTVSTIDHLCKEFQFVCKTDVKSFYESIDQSILYDQICQHISDKNIRYYIWQVIHRTVEYGGNYQEIHQGISRACPLSPILGALYLKAMDDYFSQQKQFYYVRYMDDILILSKTRWQNKRPLRI